MLTGRETLGEAFARTAHGHPDRAALHDGLGERWSATTWRAVSDDVRLLALGLVAAGVAPGHRVGLDLPDGPGRRAAELAVVTIGAVLVEPAREADGGPDGDGTAAPALVVADGAAGRPGAGGVDLSGLRRGGAVLDAAEPDAFERRWQAVGAPDPALRSGADTWTHGALVWAARSLQRALAVEAGDRLVSTLPPGDPTGRVAGLLLPALTGAATAVAAGRVVEAVAAVRPSVVVSDPAGTAALAGPLRGNGRPRFGRGATGARRREVGLGACRGVLVVGDGAVAAARDLVAAGVPATAGWCVAGHAGPVTGLGTGTLGRPMPGVTVAVDDDGEVVVRSGAVAVGRASDGWLRTGRQGELDTRGRLTLADAVGAAGRRS